MRTLTLCMLLTALALGCTGEDGKDSVSSSSSTLTPSVTDTDTDTDTPTDTDTTTTTTTTTDSGSVVTPTVTTPTVTTTTGGLPTGLNGEIPTTPLSVPTFSQVLAMDGTARSSADLIGRPTVMWFYPAAFTGG